MRHKIHENGEKSPQNYLLEKLYYRYIYILVCMISEPKASSYKTAIFFYIMKNRERKWKNLENVELNFVVSLLR